MSLPAKMSHEMSLLVKTSFSKVPFVAEEDNHVELHYPSSRPPCTISPPRPYLTLTLSHKTKVCCCCDSKQLSSWRKRDDAEPMEVDDVERVEDLSSDGEGLSNNSKC